MTSRQTTLTVHLITSHHVTLHHMTARHTTPHDMTLHLATSRIASSHGTWWATTLLRLTSQPTNWSHHSMSLHHHPLGFGHRAGCWPCARSPSKFFFGIFFLPLESSAPSSPRNYWHIVRLFNIFCENVEKMTFWILNRCFANIG